MLIIKRQISIIKSLLLVLLYTSLILLPSCNEKREITPPSDFKLDGPSDFSAPAEGMTQEFKVTSTGSWEIIRKSFETWAEPKPTKGQNDGTFQIVIDENKLVGKRTMKFAVLLNGKELPNRISVTQEGAPVAVWDERGQDKELDKVQLGIPAYNATAMIYRRNGKGIIDVELTEPVVVAVAEEPLGWGYFQFPNIYKGINENTLTCTWNMGADDAGSYGKGGGGRRLSFDNGKTWVVSTKSVLGGGLHLPNGEMISISTPAAIELSKLDLPKPIATLIDASTYHRKFTIFRHNEIPENLQGVYINRWDKNGMHSLMHATIEDDNLARYADGDLFPIVWWGDMKLLTDGSIVIAPYPNFYENAKGGVDPSAVSIYRSVNQGMTWTVKGKIPYVYDPIWDPNGNRRNTLGYTEPAFEILSDGTYLVVLRTTDGMGDSPMYITRSSDQGNTWTTPQVFTPAGVLPKLRQLENGVLVLASGRPGLQLRFSFDGQGKEWTDPFELISYEGDAHSQVATCGYPQLLVTGPDRFLIAYSDFKYPIASGETRKAIKVREIIVNKK